MFEMDWNVRFDFLSFLVSSPIFVFFVCFGVFSFLFFRPQRLSLSLSLSPSVSVCLSRVFCFHFRSVLLVSTFLEILELFKISIDPGIWDLGSDLVSLLIRGWVARSTTIHDRPTDFSRPENKDLWSNIQRFDAFCGRLESAYAADGLSGWWVEKSLSKNNCTAD